MVRIYNVRGETLMPLVHDPGFVAPTDRVARRLATRRRFAGRFVRRRSLDSSVNSVNSVRATAKAAESPPFGPFTNETYFGRQMDALTTLGVLIAVFAVSAVVVWIYASRT